MPDDDPLHTLRDAMDGADRDTLAMARALDVLRAARPYGAGMKPPAQHLVAAALAAGPAVLAEIVTAVDAADAGYRPAQVMSALLGLASDGLATYADLGPSTLRLWWSA